MRSLKLWLSPAGALIAAIGFFMPWFYIGCQPIKSKPPVLEIKVSGVQLATGKKPAHVQEFFQSFLYKITVQPIMTKYEKRTGRKLKLFAERWLLWGVFVAALLALFLGVRIATRGPTTGLKIAGVLATIAGYVFLIAGLLQHAPSRSGRGSGGTFKVPESIIYGISPGGLMLIGGLLIAMIGFWWAGSAKQKDTKEGIEELTPKEGATHTS